MVRLFSAYSRYPYPISWKVKLTNIIRWFFSFRLLDEFLGRQMIAKRLFFRKFVPPVYFYSPGSFRLAQRAGCLLKLDLSQLIEHDIFFSNYEVHGFDKFLDQIPQDGISFDIGANVGYTSLLMSRQSPLGKVYAFEPSRRNHKLLVENIKLNRVTNIISENSALGKERGEASLITPVETNFGMTRISLQDRPESLVREKVEITNIDAYVQHHHLDRVDALKIDVEGFELYVLQGGIETISMFKPAIFIELSAPNLREHSLLPSNILSFLEQNGYTMIDGATLRPVDLTTEDIHTDLICIQQKR